MGKMRTIRIEARSDDKFGVEVKAGDRTMVVDQAKSAGGAGQITYFDYRDNNPV